MTKKKRNAIGPKRNKPMSVDVEDLLQQAEADFANFQTDLAEKKYVKALEMEPNNTKVMDSFALFLLEIDRLNEGKQLLERSIELNPLDNISKYLQLAQLLEGNEAIRLFERGVSLIQHQKEQLESNSQRTDAQNEELITIGNQLSCAFCSMAEIYLTDCCFEENAEAECQRLLNCALDQDPSNPETYQTLASLRISQQCPEEALQFLRKSYDLWKDLDFEWQPSYEFRHNTAKLFFELGENSLATNIWETLLEENDQIAEVHYFLASSYRKISTQAARECANQAKQLLLLCNCEDKALLKMTEDLIDQLANENVEIEIDSDENADNNNLDTCNSEDMDVENTMKTLT